MDYFQIVDKNECSGCSENWTILKMGLILRYFQKGILDQKIQIFVQIS